MTARELVTQWQAEAAVLRRRGQEGGAVVLEGCAAELESALAAGDGERLTLAQAALVSGYSVPHLRRLIAEGSLRNVASEGRPMVRRGDLPRKPGHAVPSLSIG